MSRVTQRQAKRTRERSPRKRLGTRQLEALIEEAIVDAYGESEQRVGFLTMLQENLAVPFATEILGIPVRVERVDLNDAEEIVAICRRGRERQTIPILDLLPSPPPAGYARPFSYAEPALSQWQTVSVGCEDARRLPRGGHQPNVLRRTLTFRPRG